MDSVTLEIFKTVAAQLSITRAAALLGRVQSNVTTRIQQLETELGTALFSRDGKRLQLTEQGALYLQYAERILALVNEAQQAMHPQVPQGVLRLGTMESTAASRLPQPLSQFHQTFSQVTLQITSGPSQRLMELLVQGQIDCALLAPPQEEGTDGAFLGAYGFAGEPAFDEVLRVVLPRAVTEADLLAGATALSLVAFEPGCSYRLAAQQWLFAANAPWARSLTVHEVGSYHAMLACVASGQSFSLMPQGVLQLCRIADSVQLGASIPATTWLVWREGYASAAFLAFRDLLRQRYEREAACPA